MSKHASEATSAKRQKERMLELELLNPDQLRAVQAIEDGKLVYLGGAGGVGKSHVINFLRNHSTKKIDVTAPTGVAAVNIGGCTIHSWAGLGIGTDPKEKITKKLEKQLRWAYSQKKADPKSFAAVRIKQAEILVIDEISMMSHELFVMLDHVCRKIRRVDRPFGGIQLVVVGDFFQLPPVFGKVDQCKTCGAEAAQSDHDGLYRCTKGVEFKCKTTAWDGVQRFAFSDGITKGSNLWNKCGFTNINLTKVVRQTNREFIDILHAIRTGDVTPDQLDRLAEECETDTIDVSDGILATDLFAKNAQVDERNSRAYRDLPVDTIEVVYNGIASSKCTDKRSVDFGKPVDKSRLLAMLTRHVPAKGVFRAKVGTQVMLTTNMNVDQGLCNGARGVVVGFQKAGAMIDHKKIGVIESPVIGMEPIVYPVVNFLCGDGTHVTTVVEPKTWVNETSVEKATFTQIPLTHAWGITIHKSQGATLTKMRAHLDEAFAEGQVYVALSRAAGMRGHLHLASSIDPECIKVSPIVKAWSAAQTQTQTQTQTQERKRKVGDAGAAAAGAAAASADRAKKPKMRQLVLTTGQKVKVDVDM